ncbi:uncharacterized protein A4U43_C03F15930 [Asparagus officinalis]|uniref:DUF629 domain-containing protein n=2 Tax=Asparagus officinalis TaxID=4686 RepID=A0A5P1FFE1_ASPOF|nr:uncharacterized protein A4U43_C03F15930 [Asparagus officinalis]
MAFYQQSLMFILRAHSVGPITDIMENCPASCSSSSLASRSADPPPDEVQSLNDQAQGDKPCPANSIASFPPDNVKDLAEKALPSSHQGEEPCPSHSSSSSLVSTSTNPHPPDEEVKILCRQAFQFLCQGDLIGAHDTLNNVRHQHESSSLFHYTRSLVLCNYFKTLTNDPEGWNRKIQEAIDSAHQATILSPNILEFSFHYVRLLVLHRKFEEAAKECERAFVIINHYDFLPQGYEDKTGLEISATEVNHYQKRFRFLLNMLKSPIASAHCKVMLAEKEQAYRIPSCLEYLWRDLIRVNVNDFKKWSEQNSRFLHIITEALEFYQEKHTWKFWVCPRCPGKRFEYFESKMQHVLKEHTDKLSEELKPFFPEKYDQDWVVKLVNNIVNAKITKNLDTSKPLKLNLEKTCDSYKLEFLSPFLKSYMQNVNSDWVDKIVSCTWEPIDVQVMTGDSNRLPLSNHPERKELLKRIRDYFRILILHNYLLKTHLDRILSNAMRELQAHSSAELLLSHGVNNQSVDCIRALDSLQLQKVLEFLQSLTQDHKLEPYAEPHDPSRDVVFNIPECDVRIRAFFYDSSPHIDLDLKILSSSEDTSSPDNGTKCFPDVNSMLFWLYEHNLMQIINGWSHQRNKGQMEADRILKKLEKEIEDLTRICTVKGELLTYLVHIEHLKGVCEKELMERENSVEVSMTKWKEELTERAETGNDFMIRVISFILTEAEAFRASQDGDDAINNDENHPKTSSLDNIFIKAVFRKLEESYDKKICIVDGKIMKNLATARQLQFNLEQACVNDFLVVLLPLLKIYIQEVVMRKAAEQTTSEPGASGAAHFMKLLHTAESSPDKGEEKQIQEISKGIKKRNKPKKPKGRKFR